MTTRERSPLLVLAATGPAAFTATWAIAGALREGYAPLDTAISRLAAAGTSTQPAMTAGILALAAGLAAFATGARQDIGRNAAIVAGASAAATIGVAALPLEVSSAIDVAHGVAAVSGYATLALVPLLADARTSPLPRSVALAASALTAGCLLATNVDDFNGFFQRAGLAFGHSWIVATSLVLFARGRRRRGD